MVKIDMQQKVVIPGGGKSASSPIVEIDGNFLEMFGLRMSSGSMFSDEQYKTAAPVCLLDKARAIQLFGDAEPVGKEIEIRFLFKTIRLTVIGIVEDPLRLRSHIDAFDTASTSREAAMQYLTFKNVYVMLGVYKRALSKGSIMREVPLMLVKPDDISRLEALHADICEFMESEDIRYKGFTMTGWLDRIAVTTERIDENSNMIWVIILGVSAVLIMLVNYLAVREKFREIAIRRIEGASRSSIIIQMGTETAMISLAAGVGGILMGIAITHALCAWVVQWPPQFTVGEMTLAIGLSLFVGVLATILPALRAAQVDPAATLRYE
jgi:putative ABC transport system permease protein